MLTSDKITIFNDNYNRYPSQYILPYFKSIKEPSNHSRSQR